MEGMPLLVVIGAILGIVVFFVFLLAPLKLYSIDKTLKAILEELRIARISRPGEPPLI
jgi:hypothetical protein